MNHKSSKSQSLPHERRRGEAALSDFAEYVEQQQRKIVHYHRETVATDLDSQSSAPNTNASPNNPDADPQQHDELDALLEQLDLGDDAPKTSLKDLLLTESGGEMVFDLGFEQDNMPMGLNLEQWNAAYARLVEAAALSNAHCQLLLTKHVGGLVEAESTKGTVIGSDCSGKVLVRREPQTVDEVIETRLSVVGNVDAGKSSLLGVLVKGDLDDGRGSARVNLFRHKHEVESGRTSSVGMEILGFDLEGHVVGSDSGRKLSWEEIGTRSAKVISFSDLAGHERYLKTTVFGLLSSKPDYCLLMVAANNGLVGMSKEHLGIALALSIPIMVIITKIDICPPNILEQTLKSLTKILKSPGARKIPIFVKTYEDCVNTATQFVSRRICPVFQVSNVTGANLDLVRTFLNILPHHGNYDSEAPFEFHVNDIFSVPFIGTVVSGIVKSGVVHAGDSVLIGPNSLGQFTPTIVRSIERKRIGVMGASAGQSASFALRKVRSDLLRKGMVVLPRPENGPPPPVYREFVAEVLILFHATTIKLRYQAMLHIGPVRQTCAIIDLDRKFIRTGDRALVAFRFVQRPEYITVGTPFLFREGRTKGLGIIKEVGYDSSKPLLRNGEEDEQEEEEQTQTPNERKTKNEEENDDESVPSAPEVQVGA
ncbi:GTP-binding protein 1 [Ceratocystis lukuohia]|uniref:GTP-binding protein 1 n=1 Tax=Ceratocystis lukuohia TaxID=2019550 RepID=A0ABR4MN83_9PEZI